MQLEQSDKQSVSIATMVRVRPLLPSEQQLKQCIHCLDDKTIQITLSQQKRKQTIQKVFPTDCTQRQLFSSIENIINQSRKGYNVTIFTYGQTGSGKTYTMFGNDWNNIIRKYTNQQTKQSTFLRSIQQDQNHAGVIPRVIHHVFTNLITQNRKHIKIYCSFLQLYNQHMMDLLSQDPQITSKKMVIHQNKIDGIYVQGLNEVQVRDFDECIAWMQQGQRNRVVRQTNMNVKSSRSHTIFQLLIEEVFPSKQSFRRTKINLCDLAGSEKINKSEKMQSQHFQQLKNINLSLTTLGKVIGQLSTNTKPCYRDSKLTRLLQDSLGGNSYTAIIATITTKSSCLQESLNTLKFLERAKQIKTQIVTRIYHENSQMRNLEKQITYLKDLLKMKRNGLGLDIQTAQQMKKLQHQNDKLKQMVDAELIEKLTRENMHLKRQLERKNNDEILSDSYQHRTIQAKTNSHNASQIQIRTSSIIPTKQKFNISYSAKDQKSSTGNNQAKTTIFPSIHTKNKIAPSRNFATKILDRINAIERIKQSNKVRLEHDLQQIQQRQSMDNRATFGTKSKYSSRNF